MALSVLAFYANQVRKKHSHRQRTSVLMRAHFKSNGNGYTSISIADRFGRWILKSDVRDSEPNDLLSSRIWFFGDGTYRSFDFSSFRFIYNLIAAKGVLPTYRCAEVQTKEQLLEDVFCLLPQERDRRLVLKNFLQITTGVFINEEAYMSDRISHIVFDGRFYYIDSAPSSHVVHWETYKRLLYNVIEEE